MKFLPGHNRLLMNYAVEWARDQREALYRRQHRRAVAMRAAWAAKQSPKAESAP